MIFMINFSLAKRVWSGLPSSYELSSKPGVLPPIEASIFAMDAFLLRNTPPTNPPDTPFDGFPASGAMLSCLRVKDL